MKLDAVRVRNYRCIEDSGWVSIDDLTCLIGKNESGKTAFMEAIEKLNPSFPVEEYDPYRDYPRQDWASYKDRHEEDPDVVASARFTLEEGDRERIGEQFDPELIDGDTATLHRDYANQFRWDLDIDGSVALDYLLDAYDFEEGVRSAVRDADSTAALRESAGDAHSAVVDELGGPVPSALSDEIGGSVLEATLPEFRLVGEYSIMAGTIDIDEVLDRRESGELSAGDQTFLSLLTVAGLDLDSFREAEDYREKMTELETASARISDEAMDYWSQSGELQIRLREAGGDDDHKLELRVENRRHNVSVGFENRSRGFRYFFSSFCQLSELREREEDLVLMLDEPGLNLHARAKQEFLEFMKDELVGRHPIFYTTHSPFMIDAENLHRTKMVMADPIGETNLFTDVALADEQTQFPLRNVFELDLMDTLLVKPQTLLVEEKADHAYLYVLSKMLKDNDQRGLDSRWTVVPIKDNGNIASFVSLFGGDRLDVAALLPEPPGEDRPRRRTDREESVEDRIPTKRLSMYSDASGGTLEDVFSRSFYLDLVNRTYATEIGEAAGVPERIREEDLPGDGGRAIVDRLSEYFAEHGIGDGEFDRTAPALYLQDNRGEVGDGLDKSTRRSFDRLFRDLNNTLESFEGVDPRGRSILETLGFG
jgi:hypothetical protein